MAAPTKEQRELNKKIQTLFKRDNNEYIDFENQCRYEAEKMGHKCFMAYKMAYECGDRIRRPYKKIREDIQKYGKRLGIKIANSDGTIRNITSLPDIAHNLPYLDMQSSYPLLDAYDIPFHLFSDDFDDDPEYKDQIIYFYNRFLEKNEENFYLLEYSKIPIIEHHRSASIPHKSALVNIDFTKPIEEIIAFVSKIKNDFDNDPTTIQHLDELLDIKPKREVYTCNFTECDIYKHKNPKPLEGRLADVLFIYDCHRLGLTKEYTLSEINRYWNDVKNLFKDKMSDNTYREYLSFANKQIDEKGYKDFLAGTKDHINPLNTKPI